MLYEAVFDPSEQSDYPSHLLKLKGKRLALHGSSVAAQGPFKGEECFYIPNTTIGLIPVRDLKNIRSVPFVEWEKTFKQLELSE